VVRVGLAGRTPVNAGSCSAVILRRDSIAIIWLRNCTGDRPIATRSWCGVAEVRWLWLGVLLGKPAVLRHEVGRRSSQVQVLLKNLFRVSAVKCRRHSR